MAGFDPDAYLAKEPAAKSEAFDPDAYLGAAPADTEPADHGLSERQKLSPVGKALSPITSYWPTYNRMNQEAQHQMSRGAGQFFNPQSAADLAYGAGNMGLGALNYVGSPINAAYRSVVGQPLEDTTGIPREYTEFAAQLATPGIGFGKLPTKPGAVAETMPKIKTLEGPDLASPQAQANRALADEFDIPLTRGQATEDAGAIRFEDMAARGAHGDELQGIAKPAFEDQFEAIQNAGQRVGQTLNRGEQPLGTPADAAASLNTEIGERAAAARATRDAEVAAAQREEQAQRAAVAERGQTIGEAISAAHGEIENPRAAGEIVNRDVRNAAARGRADFKQKYDEFGQMEGSMPLERGVGNSIRTEIGLLDNPVVVDDASNLTPAASAALRRLDQLTEHANPDAPLMFDIKGVDRMRRQLVGFYKQAQRNPEDQRAVRAIINSFDAHVERAVTDGLFSGDPRALEVLQQARAAFARYQREFMPQANDGGVGDAMRRIVQRNATAEETANMIVGSGKIGQAGLPVRIADRLEQVLGADSEAWNSVRQAIWQKASRVTNAKGEVDAARSAKGIQDLAGSTLGRRMFSPEELTAMRNHARGSRDLEGVVERTATARAERAQNAYEQAFGTGELSGKQKKVFQRMVDGTAEPEEITDAFFGVIGGGNPSDASRALSAIERVVGPDSPIMGNIRQGVWQKLTQNPFGKDPQGQQKLVQGINEFLNGKGKTISHKLYTDEERALMQRYGDAVRKTIIGKYSRTNSDTAVASGAAAQKRVQQAASMISSLLHTGPLGHIGGNWVAQKIGARIGKAADAQNAQALRDSVNDVVPKQPRMYVGRSLAPPTAMRPFAIPRMPQQRDERRAPGTGNPFAPNP